MYHCHYLEIFNCKQITIFHLMMPSFRVVTEYSMKGKRGQYLYTFELRFTIVSCIIIIIIITLLISSKRLFSLIYNVKYLKLSFPKIPLKNAVLF